MRGKNDSVTFPYALSFVLVYREGGTDSFLTLLISSMLFVPRGT